MFLSVTGSERETASDCDPSDKGARRRHALRSCGTPSLAVTRSLYPQQRRRLVPKPLQLRGMFRRNVLLPLDPLHGLVVMLPWPGECPRAGPGTWPARNRNRRSFSPCEYPALRGGLSSPPSTAQGHNTPGPDNVGPARSSLRARPPVARSLSLSGDRVMVRARARGARPGCGWDPPARDESSGSQGNRRPHRHAGRPGGSSCRGSRANARPSGSARGLC